MPTLKIGNILLCSRYIIRYVILRNPPVFTGFSADFRNLFIIHKTKGSPIDWTPLVTSLSESNDGDGGNVVAVLGLGFGELQLDAASLCQSGRRRFGVAREPGRPCHAHLGEDGATIIVFGIVLVERHDGKRLVVDGGEVERIDGDTVRELLDEVVGGDLFAVILKGGQQGGIESSFTEVEHNIISFLCGRQAGLFIQSRRLDMTRNEIGT